MTSSQDSLRALARNAISKNLFVSAAFIAEKLINKEAIVTKDVLLYAKCYFLGGEPRRCLAILEQNGLLSAGIISSICEFLKVDEFDEIITDSNCTINIEIVLLAAQCLFSIEQYEDCISLLGHFVKFDIRDTQIARLVSKVSTLSKDESEINGLAGIYFLVGKCFDIIDNRTKSLSALTICLKFDPACIEAIDYIIDNDMLSNKDKQQLYQQLHAFLHKSNREWLDSYYQLLLLNHQVSTEDIVNSNLLAVNSTINSIGNNNNTLHLVRQVEYYYEHHQLEEAYALSRHIYSIDPFDHRGLMIYIACMVEMNLKTEIYYLGHELVNSYPKLSISWYCVGCYYWCCTKLDLALKYFQKSTKLDKKFSRSWIMLGHVLSTQEESEQAISAYRTAVRLLPGNYRPLIFMAKELVRTNYLTLALQVLLSALNICDDNAIIYNELGIVYIKLERYNDAIIHFEEAIKTIDKYHMQHHESFSFGLKRSGLESVFSNYATALRKRGQLDEALFWYDKYIASNPKDSQGLADIGFTLHLMQRFEEAISYYHQALAITPNFTLCSELLNRVMMDSMIYKHVSPNNEMSDTQRISSRDFVSNGGNDNPLADRSKSHFSIIDPPEDLDASYISLNQTPMESFSRVAGRLSLSSHMDQSRLDNDINFENNED